MAFRRKKKDGGPNLGRRTFLQVGSACVAAGLLTQTANAAAPNAQMGTRELAFRNLHTDERVRAVYWENGRYQAEALKEISLVLRDHRSGEMHRIDPKVLDILWRMSCSVECGEPFDVISGYRSPQTNKLLRKMGGGVAKRSYHMQGKAVDIRMASVELRDLRKAALSLQAGGVGYYAKSQFLHIDTGPVRNW